MLIGNAKKIFSMPVLVLHKEVAAISDPMGPAADRHVSELTTYMSASVGTTLSATNVLTSTTVFQLRDCRVRMCSARHLFLVQSALRQCQTDSA